MYYITNLQGDVVGLRNSDGSVTANYRYDAWGNVTYQEGNTALLALNPLLYRGYVYDQETGLYYLQSRYYDPEIGRFISADAYVATGQGLLGNNIFAYCGNNPVLNYDPSGSFFFTALGAVTGFIGGAIVGALSGQSGQELLDTACHSAVGGAIAGAGVDAALLIVGTFGMALPAVALAGGVAFLAGGVGNAYTTYATSDGMATDGQMAASFLIGGVANIVSLGTSMGAVSSNVEGLYVSGMMDLQANISTGVRIAVATGMATSIATGSNSTKTQAPLPKISQSNVRAYSPAKKDSNVPGLRLRLPGGIRTPTIGNNIRTR